jgi:Flp pilus assembly protein TadG
VGRPSAGRRRRSRGQTLTEFALILPLFMLLIMSVVEFGFLFNSYLAINFASREASLVAAEAGNLTRADCLILDAVEQSVSVPSDRALIAEVEIFRMKGGVKTHITTYARTGSTSCTLPGGTTMVVPYAVGGNGYPPTSRCNRLLGCVVGESGVDQIGVQVTYDYAWHTPLGGLFGGSSGTTRLVRDNVMRMEPVL